MTASYHGAMKVICPTCHALVAAADINIQAMTAVCRACNDVFTFGPSQEVSVALGLPARFTSVDEGPKRFGVSWWWWRWQYTFLFFFCIAWDAILVFWYAKAFAGHSASHVAVGIGLTYFLIASQCNRTRVASDGDILTIRHGPLPWRGNRTVSVHDLADVRVETKQQCTNGQPRFAVIGVVHGKDVALLTGLDQDEANWLRQQLANLHSR